MWMDELKVSDKTWKLVDEVANRGSQKRVIIVSPKQYREALIAAGNRSGKSGLIWLGEEIEVEDDIE